MKLNKRLMYEIIQRDYIEGGKTLVQIAIELKCTQPAISYYGKMLFPNWREITNARLPASIKSGRGL